MKNHKYQWLIGGLIILVTFTIGIAIYDTQSTKKISSVSEKTIKEHYRIWQENFLVGSNHEKFVQTNDDKNQTLSEAQGYGMLIAVMAAKQGVGDRETFDQLTRYYLNHRLSKDNPLMAWRQNKQGKEMVSSQAEKTSATDGDLDIAYALILADEQWGSDGGIDYQQRAKQLIGAIKKWEINPDTQLPMVGNWATSPKTRDIVRPSDLITAYFRKFASYTQDGSWTRVAQRSQNTLKKLSDQHDSGLMADFVTVSGNELRTGTVQAKQVASKYDADYGFNACRIPWRVAYDYQLNRSRISRRVVLKMNKFFKKQKEITAVYKTNGTPIEKYQNSVFITPVVYAAQVTADRALEKRHIKSLTATMATDEYYPATVQMLILLSSGELND